MTRDHDSSMSERVRLRPIRPEDETFLREVYATTRAQELEHTGLDAAQQQAFIDLQFDAQTADYNRRFPDARRSIILENDTPVGRLLVATSSKEVRILDITVLPVHRNKGIGAYLLGGVIADAEHAIKPIRIWVGNGSPSTSLFVRLGFIAVEAQSLASLFERSPKS